MRTAQAHRSLTHKKASCIQRFIAGWLLLLVLSGCGFANAQARSAVTSPIKTATLSGRLAITTLAPTQVAHVEAPTLVPATIAVPAETLPAPTTIQIPTHTPPPAPVLLPKGYGPSDFPQNVNPLTGLTVSDVSLLNRRPMAIKVTNFPRSVRPQWGLSLADHVYEYYLEDGMTRFVGIFYGTDASRVGPVRSARLFDEHVMRMYKSIFVFGYADDRVIDPWLISDLKNFLVVERPDNCPPLCRIGSKSANYNTLFVNTQQLSEYITKRGTNNERQDLNGLRFEPFTPPGGAIGESLSFHFSRVSYNQWQYDPISQRYMRSSENQDANRGENYQPLVDSLTGQQLAADNLVILLLQHGFFLKSSDTEIYEMNFMGRGNAYALREGRLYPITWQRGSTRSLLSLVYPDGRPYPLKPGNVWFEVLSDTSQVELQPDQSWRFNFDEPKFYNPTATP